MLSHTAKAVLRATKMKKLLIAVMVAGAFSGTAFAACTDTDLTPDIFNSIQENDSLGDLQARLPCGVPTPTSYTDAIGREFKVYTWSTLNKSMTIQAFENRVFTKTGSGLGFQATKAAPPAATFDGTSNVLSLPVITIADDQGQLQTYYDAKIAMNDNGSYSILSMDSTQRGDVLYDTRGYAPANLDLKTGSLTVPTLASTDGKTVAFQAVLNSANGTWKDGNSGDTLGVISQNQTPSVTPDAASFDSASRVMTLPVLQMTDTAGNTTTYYDAKIALTENGGWSLLSKSTTHTGNENYDLSTYVPANLDLKTGMLVVPQLTADGSTTATPFRAQLAADGSWTDQSDAVGFGKVSSIQKEKVTPTLAAYDTATKVMTLPVLSVKDATGKETMYYDAQISLSENGDWTILGMDTVKKNNQVYDVTGYQAARLDLTTGALVVPKLSDNEGGALAFRAVLANDGTWKDASDDPQKGFVPNNYTLALVGQQRFDTTYSNKTWPGLVEGGIVVIQGVAYRNTQSGCAIPSSYDSVKTVTTPNSAGPMTVQMIENNPTVKVYHRGTSLYVTVDGWEGGCQVTDMGTAPASY